MTCAICMDDITEATVLPCKCRVEYCNDCWDKSLAQSFKSHYQAKCPTCRLAISPDFDAAKGHLVFSLDDTPPIDMDEYRRCVRIREQKPDTPEGQQAEARIQQILQERTSYFTATVNRLVQQVAPVVCQRLAYFGEENPRLQEVAKGKLLRPFADESLERLRERAKSLSEAANVDTIQDHAQLEVLLRRLAGGSNARLASYWASTGGATHPPYCICRSELKRTTGRERSFMAMEAFGFRRDDQRVLREIERRADADDMNIVCDVCESHVKFSHFTWTCVGGSDTIMHPSSYDICDDCFIKHVFDVQPE
eukprot:CAMPEP_0206495524 /NCGR_PEP_ID=MMETSP0324_2-20121206/48633_1 /ASSEMBLY_ACC=CAM_ASM_000836 /TAXON_ID=2866 /ORGANISM="Crypthecodinium cohnii, Strain Seligo" /LENGTH=308 /DNA_ID=CAMNT_0053979903 /DNA_START=109 /DNA_END=1035 /DNA_ORIENTATION=-